MTFTSALRVVLFVASGGITAVAGVIGVASAFAALVELATGPSHSGLLVFLGLPGIPIALLAGWATLKLAPRGRLPKA